MKSATIYAVTSVLLCLILFYLADLTLRQSIVLAMVIAWLVVALGNASQKPLARFSPYWARISPNWHQILTDYKVLRNEEEWVALQNTMATLPNTEHSDAVNGFFYTVVQHSPQDNQMLLYLGRYHAFTTEVDFQDYLRPFGLDRELWPNSLEHIGSIGVFMKSGVDAGYNLGIRVQMDWWQRMKSFCPPVLKEDLDHPCGCVNLTLAVLPYREFSMYWDPVEWKSDYSDKLWVAIKEERNKHQWFEKQESDSEFAYREPKEISHKYFYVRHDSI